MSPDKKHHMAACAASNSPRPCSDDLRWGKVQEQKFASGAGVSDAAVERRRSLSVILVASGVVYLVAFLLVMWWVFAKLPVLTASPEMDSGISADVLARDATDIVEVTTTSTDVGTNTLQVWSSQEAAPDPVTSTVMSVVTETSESVTTSTSTVNEDTTTLVFTTTEVVKHTTTIRKNVSTKTVHPTTTTIHPYVETTSKVLTLTTTTTVSSASANAHDRRTLPPAMLEAATETAWSRSGLSHVSSSFPDLEGYLSSQGETESLSLGPSTAAFDKRAMTYTWTTVTSTRHKRRTRDHTKTTSQTMTMTDVQASTKTLIVATWTTTLTIVNSYTTTSTTADPVTGTQGFLAPSSKKSDPPKETPKKPDPPKPGAPPPPLADPKATNCPASQNTLRLSTKHCTLVPAGDDEGSGNMNDCGEFCDKALTDACDFCWTGRKGDFGGRVYNPNYKGVGSEWGYSHTWTCCNKHCECAKKCWADDKVLKDNAPRDPKGVKDEKCV